MLLALSPLLLFTAKGQTHNDLNSSEYNGTANSTNGILSPNALADNNYKRTTISPSELPNSVMKAYNKSNSSLPITEIYTYPYYWDNQPQYFDFHSNSDTVDYSGWTNPPDPQYYELTYIKNGRTCKSVYAKDGTLMHISKIIKDKELPATVDNAFKNSSYSNWDIVGEKEKVSRKNPDVTIYKIKVRRGDDTHVLRYRQDGQLIAENEPNAKK